MSENDSLIIEIEVFFKQLSCFLEESNKKYLHDAARKCETLFCDIINHIHGWHLVNLNELVSNHPAIDLADEKRRVAVQITSQSNYSQKISTVLASFEKQRKSHQNTSLSDYYDRLIFLFLTDTSDMPSAESRSGYQIEIWNLQTLAGQIKSLPENIVEQVLSVIRHAKDSGLLYPAPLENNSGEYSLDQTIIETKFTSAWAYGLGSVRIDAFLPVSYRDELSALILFRDLTLSDGMKTYGEADLLSFFKQRGSPLEDRSFVVGSDGTSVLLQLRGERFYIERYAARQLCSLLDALAQSYQQKIGLINQTLGSQDFECTGKGLFRLMEVPVGIWNMMYNFAACHSVDLGESQWHIFNQQHDINRRLVTLIHSHYQSIICQIWCEYESQDYCSLYWKPGWSNALMDMDGYDNSRKWKVDFLHDWIINKWMPLLCYEYEKKTRTISQKIFGRFPTFEQYESTFDPQRYGVYSRKARTDLDRAKQ